MEEINKIKNFWREHGHPHGAGRILEKFLGGSKSLGRVHKLKKTVLEELELNPDQDRDLYENLKASADTSSHTIFSRQDMRKFYEGLEQFGVDFNLVCDYIRGDMTDKILR